VQNPASISRGVASIEVDGILVSNARSIHLADDGALHVVTLVMGPAPK